MIYKLGDFAKKVGVKPRTLITWDVRGVFPAKKTFTGRRYYDDSDVDLYLGTKRETVVRDVYLYCRVSTKNQKNDLLNQIDYLKNYCKKNGIKFKNIIEDFGSGLNYKRKGFNDLLNLIEDDTVSSVYFTHKDRFIRFGYDWFFSFAKKHNCELIPLTEETKDVRKELVDDLISIVHVFSCKLYGLRNYKKKGTTKLEKKVKEILNDKIT